MGGNALKEADTKRISKEEYEKLIPNLLGKLNELFPENRIKDIPSYRSKADFGDADILIVSDWLPSDWVEKVKETFTPKQMVKNGDVLSFEFGGFQIDLISSPKQEYDFTFGYFSFNDLGNLIGRVSHKMGFKFAHNGLRYIVRDPNNDSRIISDLVLTLDFPRALEFCGFKPETFGKGFEDLPEIYQYVLTSKYFNQSCFLLENRSYQDRVRDKKRTTYMGFLSFLRDKVENGESLPAYQIEKPIFLQKAFEEFPEFKAGFDESLKKIDKIVEVSKKFNAQLVTQITGFEKVELGKVLRDITSQFENKDAFLDHMIKSSNQEIEIMIKSAAEKVTNEEVIKKLPQAKM